MRLMLPFVLAWAATLVAQSQSAAPPVRSIRDGVYTAEQADRGQALYNVSCAYCHMADLQGNPPIGKDVSTNAPSRSSRPPQTAPGSSSALVGPGFVGNWEGLSLGDLYERIRISMPQDSPGSLSRQTNADITAFMLKANGYSAGPNELTVMKAALDEIRIVR